MGRSRKKNKRFIYTLFFSSLVLTVSVWTLIIVRSTRKENPWITRSKYIFGIDISHYQGIINWTEFKTTEHPVRFIFIRSTMGANTQDKTFSKNWSMAKKQGFICGAYHYYRPNENSTKQFTNFSTTVKLQSGDFPPILDIEETSNWGMDNLRKGILNWLKLAEEKYGVKPVIYTGRTFYEDYLVGYVDEYPLWIASYSGNNNLKTINWKFHQFTDQVRIMGINVFVDGNFFKGELSDLKNMCLP